MKQSIKERVHALRMTFHSNSIKAFIIPSTDPHLSEYVAPPLDVTGVDFRFYWFCRNSGYPDG